MTRYYTILAAGKKDQFLPGNPILDSYDKILEFIESVNSVDIGSYSVASSIAKGEDALISNGKAVYTCREAIVNSLRGMSVEMDFLRNCGYGIYVMINCNGSLDKLSSKFFSSLSPAQKSNIQSKLSHLMSCPVYISEMESGLSLSFYIYDTVSVIHVSAMLLYIRRLHEFDSDSISLTSDLIKSASSMAKNDYRYLDTMAMLVILNEYMRHLCLNAPEWVDGPVSLVTSDLIGIGRWGGILIDYYNCKNLFRYVSVENLKIAIERS